jgi:hypothetical protein
MTGHPGRRVSFWLARWPWVWPALLILMLAAAAAWLIDYARDAYDATNPDGWQSVYADGVLNGAIVVVLGAAVTALLALVGEVRARTERQRDKRLDLFRRLRGAHLRVALTQQILWTQRNGDVYRERMRDLLQVIKDLEEIREEVKVSGNLYRGHRLLIMEGIAKIIAFLQEGIAEYHTWSPTAEDDSKAPDDGWLTVLVEQLDPRHHSEKSKLPTSHEDWEPKGNMPPDYDAGLFMSKLVMRAYVYGSRDMEAKSDTDPPVLDPADPRGDGPIDQHTNRESRTSSEADT